MQMSKKQDIARTAIVMNYYVKTISLFKLKYIKYYTGYRKFIPRYQEIRLKKYFWKYLIFLRASSLLPKCTNPFFDACPDFTSSNNLGSLKLPVFRNGAQVFTVDACLGPWKYWKKFCKKRMKFCKKKYKNWLGPLFR